MRTILCYGDSNTWGATPDGSGRFGPEVRWTGVMKRVLGDGFRVIEEGLNGRTTRWDDAIEPSRNGATYLRPCLESHRPLDGVSIMLGTNDLKRRFDLTASDIAQSAAGLGEMARQVGRDVEGRPPVVLLVAPPATVGLTDYDEMFAGAGEKSGRFAEYFRRAAGWYDLAYFDAGSVVGSSPRDGIHFEAEEHRKLGEALAAEWRRLLGGVG